MPLPPPSPTSTAVVTGASSGIGADIARELAAAGTASRWSPAGRTSCRALAAELGDAVRVEVIACDVADADARAGLFDEVDAPRSDVSTSWSTTPASAPSDAVARQTSTARSAQVRVNVEAVIDLTTRAVQHDGAPRPGCDPQRRLDGRLPTVPRSGRVRRDQGVRPQPTPRACAPNSRAPASPSPRSTPGRCAPSSCRAAGMDERTFAEAFPKFMWMPSREVARIGVDALRTRPRHRDRRSAEPAQDPTVPADPEAAAAAAARQAAPGAAPRPAVIRRNVPSTTAGPRRLGQAGADCLPRTSLPGNADVGTPFSAMTSPETTVAT